MTIKDAFNEWNLFPSLREKEWARSIGLFVTSGLTIGGLQIGVVNLLQAFGLVSDTWLKDQGLNGFIAIGILSLLGGALFSLITTVMRFEKWKRDSLLKPSANPDQSSGEKLSSELETAVEKLYRSKEYVEVVRLGVVLSRPLWLSGRWKERVAIGKLVEEAASRKNLQEEQVDALIDMMGWTSAMLGNHSLGQKHIKDGIGIATSTKQFYMVAKGYRHLAGIAQKYGKDIPAALKYLDEAEVAAKQIVKEYDREEMQAGIHYARTEIFLESNDLPNAEKHNELARESYDRLGDQEERIIKTQTQHARIMFAKGEIQQAKDIFRRAIETAKNLSRPDEQAYALVGLAKIYLSEEDYSQAIEHLGNAETIFAELEMKPDLRAAKELRLRAETDQTLAKDKD
jgi:hypothetical protein